MKHPNSDDMEKPNSQPSINENTREVEEALLEQTEEVEEALLEQNEEIEEALPEQIEEVDDALLEQIEEIEEALPEQIEEIEEALPEQIEEVDDALLEQIEEIENTLPQQIEEIDDKLPEQTEEADDDPLEQIEEIEEALPEQNEEIDDDLPEQTEKVEDALLEQTEEVEEALLEQIEEVDDDPLEQTEKVEDDPLEQTEEIEDALLEQNEEIDDDPLEQTEKRPAIILAPSPTSEETNAATSSTADNHNGNGQSQQNGNTQKPVVLNELVSLAPEVIHVPTQPPITNSTDKPIKQSRSRPPLRNYKGPSKRPTGILVPTLPTVPSVRTPATLQMLRAQRRKRLLIRHLSRKHMRECRVKDKRTANRFWFSIFTTITVMIILLLSITGGGAYAAYSFYTTTENQYAAQILDLRNLMPGDNLKLYDRNGILIGQDLEEGVKTNVPLKQISPFLIKATIDTEDKGFWTNAGIDVNRIIQAAIDDLRSNRVVAGGSTITQQLIKNLILTKDQNFQRKLQEIALVPDVNGRYSKSDILEMYLNSNNYGQTAYGPQAAATIYFGLQDQGDKSAASQLDLAQAAMIAGIPNSPSANNPLLHPEKALDRMRIVLSAMLNNHDITKVQELDALNEAQQPDFFKTSPSLVNRAPHFYHFILDQLEQQYHLTAQQIAMSDMKVYTTLDITLQDKIQQIAKDQIGALAALNATNAAEVLIDFHTGAIISMLGSLDYYNTAIDGQYNVALGYRQPGSSFKPYVYVTAFRDGISPGQGVADQPLTIRVSDTETFSPQNADAKTHGQMTIRCALQNSFNIPAVRTLQYVGIDNAMQTAYDMGVTSYQGSPGYSLVLGGLGVRLLDHTSAYGTFANAGVHVPYYGVEKVVFASTNHVDQHKADPGTRVLSPQLAYMMTNVLSDNVARTPEFTKCSVLSLFSNSQNSCYGGNPGVIRPAAAKTGTTNDFRDNWTMGYTTDYVMGVWAGNDDNTPMKVVFGVQGAAPIWHDAMLVAEQGHPIRDFTNPGGLQTATVTYPDGVHSTDLFLQGQDPNKAATNLANQTLAPRGTGGVGARYCPNS